MHPFQGCALGHYATSPRSERTLYKINEKARKNPYIQRRDFDFSMERAMGLEPTTAAMARRYSSQLSYAREGCDQYIDIL